MLVDGPWRLRWYWREDLEAMQAASLRMGYPDTHPSAQLRGYHPTADTQPHPDHPDLAGRVWRYTPPTDPGSDHGAADAHGAASETTAQRSPADDERSTATGARDRRVLVTGSRTFTDTATIREALAGQWGDGTAVLVTGACPRGADALAEACWRAWGGRVERHPADWQTHGRSAGYRRNADMVATGADVCLAFLHGPSRGTRHTADLAARAGIPTRRYPHPDTAATTPTDTAKDTSMGTENDHAQTTDRHETEHGSGDPGPTSSGPAARTGRSVPTSMSGLWERWQDWNARDVAEHAARIAEARAATPAARPYSAAAIQARG